MLLSLVSSTDITSAWPNISTEEQGKSVSLLNVFNDFLTNFSQLIGFPEVGEKYSFWVDGELRIRTSSLINDNEINLVILVSDN